MSEHQTDNERGAPIELWMSIGAVSKATGIPSETLRTWERRYGFPRPTRTEGGHRKYASTIVPKLARISQALSIGHRASDVVGESMERLDALLAEHDREKEAASASDAPCLSDSGEIIGAWMDLIKDLDSERFDQALARAWFGSHTLDFVTRLLAPFLEEVGRAWYEAEIAVLHEQFASEHVQKFLQAQWEALSERADGDVMMCATLPGEFHVLGLHMSALVCASAGRRVKTIKRDTSLSHIASLARGEDVAALLVSVSSASAIQQTSRQLQELNKLCAGACPIVVGGLGAPAVKGTITMRRLDELERWARQIHTSSDSRRG